MFQVNVVGDGRSEVMSFGNEMLCCVSGECGRRWQE